MNVILTEAELRSVPGLRKENKARNTEKKWSIRKS